MSTDLQRSPASALAGAFAGVFATRPGDSVDRLRGRLSWAAGPERSTADFVEGRLSVACGAGVAMARSSNGEIGALVDGHVYNRRELALELGLDVEAETAPLVAAGYAALGQALFARLRGDFSLLVWDEVARSGLLVRDHLGGRGLYVRELPGGVAFASEPSDLRRLFPQSAAPDRASVVSILISGIVPHDRGLFEGVRPVPPATFLRFSENGADEVRYWKLRHEPRSGLTPADAAGEVRDSIERAVRRRATSEPSAVLLSGGIDSASVAGVAASSPLHEERPRRSYSAVFPRNPEIDEADLIREVADHAGLEATALRLDSGGLLLGTLPFIARWGLPPTTPNLSFLHPLVERAATDGVRVLLDGEGGDAVFWHPIDLLGVLLRRGRLPAAWRLAGRFPEYGVPTTSRTRLQKLRAAAKGQESRPAPPRWLRRDLVGLVDTKPAPAHAEGPAWWTAQVESLLGPGSRMMHDTSRRHAALSGVEQRHPLLDVDLIELALSLPPRLAFDRRYNRPLLRHAVQGLVPDPVRLRPYKSNFDPIVIEGVESDMPAVEGLLLSSQALSGEYVERQAVAELLASPPSALGLRRQWAMAIWQLATIECWLRHSAGLDPIPGNLMQKLQPATYSFVRP